MHQLPLGTPGRPGTVAAPTPDPADAATLTVRRPGIDPHHGMRWAARSLVALALLGGAGSAKGQSSQDWPRLWGPGGRATSEAQLALGDAPEIRELWHRPIGSGHSGISTSGELGFTCASDGTDDYILAFDLDTGAERWRTRLGPTHRGHNGSRDGPMSTPTLDAGRAYVVGPLGVLLAVDAASGRVLWRRDLAAELGAPSPEWGFATSPLVTGGLVIVQAGGPAHNLVAFDAGTGELRWSANESDTVGYSSPVLATLAGVPQVITSANDLLFAVEPDDGTLLWKYPFSMRLWSARLPIALPGDRVLLQERDESRLLRVREQAGRFAVDQIWISPRLRTSFSPSVLHGGYLFGIGQDSLLCLDTADASVVWRAKIGSGSLILVGDHLVILSDQGGTLRVVEASPRGYHEVLESQVFDADEYFPITPVYARGRILLRHVREIAALEVR